jgi:hypothetical protein
LTITPVRKSRKLPRGGRICVVKDAIIALGTAIEAKGATMRLARGAMRGSRSKWYRMRGVVPRPAKVDTTTTFPAPAFEAAHRVRRASLLRVVHARRGEEAVGIKYCQDPHERKLEADSKQGKGIEAEDQQSGQQRDVERVPIAVDEIGEHEGGDHDGRTDSWEIRVG